MKKIFLMAYVRKNFGDDMFIKMLVEKYPMHRFYLRSKDNSYTDKLATISNLEILPSTPDLNEALYNSDVSEYDAYVYIGGSIFMENGGTYKHSEDFYQFIKKCNENNRPFYYLSCNYGPYSTQEFFNYSRKIFNKCSDICFRDKASYDLFKDIKNVRYAPDFIFNYNDTEITKIPNSIGISVIDLNCRTNLKNKQNDYINSLSNNIRKYIEDGKTIYLYSFCKYEGDEKTIDTILKKFPNNSNIIPVKYDGDIDKFINTYKKMEYFICSRFHSAILSSIFKQKTFITSYSQKTNNVINDLGFNLPIVNISDFTDDFDINIADFKVVPEDKLELAKKEAAHQDDGVKKYAINMI